MTVPARRRRVPTVLQMEATECGAACLAMILAAYRRWVPLEELRAACGVSRDGSKAGNLLRAARQHGLAAKGYRVELPQLARCRLPAILFWAFDHFVVLEGLNPRTGAAWINDPASGPRLVPADEFDRKFTGVVLTFEPGPGFSRSGAALSLVGGLLSRLGRSRWAVALQALISIGLVVPGLAAPILTQVFVDEILIPRLYDWSAPLLLGLLLTAITRGGLAALQRALTLRLEAKLSAVEAARLFWHLLSLPIEFFALRYVGDLASRVGSVERVASLLAAQTGASIAAAVTVAFYGVIMALYNPVLAAVALGAVAANALFLRMAWRRQDDAARRQVREMARLGGTSMAILASVETLKAAGREIDAFGRWAGVQAAYLNAEQTMARTAALLAVVPRALQQLTNIAILGVGGLAVMRGDLTIGGLVAFQALAAGLSVPVGTLVNLAASAQAMTSELARIADVLRYKPANRPDIHLDPGAPNHRQRPIGRLELRDVTFGYSALAPPLLDGVSLVLEPGARVAVVGGSGSGKSTLGRLAAGLYRPWSGEVLLDGAPIEHIPQAALASHVAHVDQSVFLFRGTVRDNLTLWDPSTDDAVLVRALADAGLLATVEARSGRLDSPVLEFGANFSGGQRQRMEIARALATDPALLILDEATAALDPLVEEEIEAAIRRRGCATLVIAHRLSTVRDADEIIVLDRGKIVQRGRHEQLQAVDGPYRHLMQSGADSL